MMNKLTDLELCKRIAEIEGEEVTVRFDWDDNLRTRLSYGSEFEDRMPEYNPLTDDALCFRLMVKYDIRVESFEPTLKDGSDGYEYHCYKQGALNYASNTLSISKSPNLAICLAIIEAHKND